MADPVSRILAVLGRLLVGAIVTVVTVVVLELWPGLELGALAKSLVVALVLMLVQLYLQRDIIWRQSNPNSSKIRTALTSRMIRDSQKKK